VSQGKVYCGRRGPSGRCSVLVLPSNAKGYNLPHVVRHSPDGFEWGYGGSGPADLALSLLTDATSGGVAEVRYQQFKADIVANLDRNHWELTGGEISQWLTLHRSMTPPREQAKAAEGGAT